MKNSDDKKFRICKDGFSEMKIPEGLAYGAQTARTLVHFSGFAELMPLEIVKAITLIKRACAGANFKFAKLTAEKAEAIEKAVDKVLSFSDAELRKHFPITVWQTGSGTASNMNANEVIAYFSDSNIHANDDVNMSQSTNDVFPAALHVATVLTSQKLLIAIDKTIKQFDDIEKKYSGIVKTGRTHLMDATPIGFSQEISGYKSGLIFVKENILQATDAVLNLPIGGTAVGTGINAPIGFDKEVCKNLAKNTGFDFKPCANKFTGLSQKNELLQFSSSLRALAVVLIKTANDIRWLASGPNAGLSEIKIPANEPGSSIMPGKINPTQCESLAMVCTQVIGLDSAVASASMAGNFELNVYMPLIGYNIITMMNMLSAGMENFNNHLLSGLEPNTDVMKRNVENSLMLATAFTPILGYDKVSEVVKFAEKNNTTLKQAMLENKLVTETEFEKIIDNTIKGI